MHVPETTDAARRTSPSVILGAVFADLGGFQRLVHACSHEAAVVQTDFTFAAPIYKGTPAIKAALLEAQSALDKFDVYFAHALLDEPARIAFGAAFRRQYASRFPGSERSDLFLASGDVLRVDVELAMPHQHARGDEALAAVVRGFCDPHVAQAVAAGEAVDRSHVRARLRVFFDHVHNPRRHRVPEVRAAAEALNATEPYVAEIEITGGIPGYHAFVLRPLVEHAGGKLVFLEL